jgi:hypothetical protein
MNVHLSLLINLSLVPAEKVLLALVRHFGPVLRLASLEQAHSAKIASARPVRPS